MINLLPPAEKNNILMEEKLKLILIFGLFIFTFFLSLILIFLSIRVTLFSQLAAQKIVLDRKEKEFNEEEFKIFKNEINQKNQLLRDLQLFYRQKNDFSGFLVKIYDLLPKNVFLNEISVSPLSQDKQFQVSISGFALLIEDVIEFREKIKQEKNFSQIYIPSSTWVKNKEVDFNITFQAQFK